jgi:hypothetical protein
MLELREIDYYECSTNIDDVLEAIYQV